MSIHNVGDDVMVCNVNLPLYGYTGKVIRTWVSPCYGYEYCQVGDNENNNVFLSRDLKKYVKVTKQEEAKPEPEPEPKFKIGDRVKVVNPTCIVPGLSLPLCGVVAEIDHDNHYPYRVYFPKGDKSLCFLKKNIQLVAEPEPEVEYRFKAGDKVYRKSDNQVYRVDYLPLFPGWNYRISRQVEPNKGMVDFVGEDEIEPVPKVGDAVSINAILMGEIGEDGGADVGIYTGGFTFKICTKVMEG